MRAVLLAVVAGMLFGCSGSGCSGMEPIPGGFPLDRRVENGIQARLTSSGIGFVETNIEPILGSLVGGSLSFPVPAMTQSLGGIADAEICHSGQCYFCLEITSVDLVPTPPNQLRLVLNVMAWTGNAECGRRGLDIVVPTFLGDIECAANVDTRATGAPDMPVTGTVVFNINTTTGYTELEFADLDATSGLETDDISIDGGFICTMVDWVSGLFIGSLTDGLNDQLAGAMGDFTCQSCETVAECPSGATCDDGTCMRGGECVAPLLGMEGRLDLGALLAGVSPGTQAQVDMVVAAGGYAHATNEGMSLGMYGGMEPVGSSHCVPPVDPPSLGPVPIASGIHDANTCAACDPPDAHAILGVSETFLNRAGWAFHQSGGLCLGIGGGTLPVTSGALAMLMPSLRSITWGEESPIAIELRPAQPPVFELGPNTAEDPLLAVSMQDVSIDFYLWGHDRYVRLMTASMDLTVNLDLRAVDGEIQVAVSSLENENLVIENSELLAEDPATLAAALSGLIDTMLGPMLGDLGSFPLPPMSGFTLNIPTGGLGYLEESGEEFLLINAVLGIATEEPAPAPMPLVHTHAEIVELQLPPTEAFDGMADPAQVPRVFLALDAEGADTDEAEFRWRVDSGLWTPWTTDRNVVVEHGVFLFQGRHRIEVQARIAEQPDTTDPVPVELEVLIDTVPPEVTITEIDVDRLAVDVRDMVSPDEAIRLEWRDGEAWQPLLEGTITVDPDADTIEVRATDEAGNVSVSRHAIRGRLPTDGSSGCGGCATTSRVGRIPGVMMLTLLAGLLFWRRRRVGSLLVVLLACASLTACGGGGGGDGDGGVCGPDAPEGCCESDDDCADGRCCMSSNTCVTFTPEDDTCTPPETCAEIPLLDEFCGFQPCASCEGPRPLMIGLIGLHSSIAILPDGSAWIAGYAAGTSYNRTYGDLAVAHVEASTTRVPDESWSPIDGVPAVAPTGDPAGWRGGISEAGEDVGRYASVAVDASGNIGVAYYDTTNSRLKYMSHSGGAWSAPVVVDGDAATDAGRFADLAFLPDGVPAIAYMVIENAGDHNVTRARYIEANDAAGSSWGTPVDLDVLDPTPLPAEGTVSDVPEGTGVWPDLAVGSGGTLGVVFYNRTNGDLMGAAFDGVVWGAPQVLAGSGDSDQGWTPSLAIDASGVWHMSFVDGIAEDLIYMNTSGVREIIDGRSLGEHWNLRGDDSTIAVLPSGEVRVAYQDSTAHQLWFAARDPSGVWTREQLSGPVNATATEGFYVSHVLHGTTSVVSAWFYDAQASENGVVIFWR
jgi:hypothetical protein